MMLVKFRTWDCKAVFSHYINGNRTAIQLVDNESGEPIATATVNIPEAPLEEGEILVKDWSENQGMARALEDASIAIDTGFLIPTGHVAARVMKLTDKAQQHIKRQSTLSLSS